MIKASLRGLLGRKFRAVLTALAIVLGVAMVSGTYVLTDTIDKAFNAIFQESYANTDAFVTGRAEEISFQGLSAEAPPIDASLLETIRALPNVEVAAGGIADQTNTKILTREGKAINTNGAPSLGIGADFSPESARFNPLRLEEGRWPREVGEVVIDVDTAESEDYAVGKPVRIGTLKPVREFTVVGLAKYGDLESLGTATFAVFTIEQAQELLDREGKFDSISVAAKPGVTPKELVAELRDVVPASARVRTGVAQADKDSEAVAFTEFIRYFLLAFAGIALFVGAFVIFNTLSITVAQRTREFATLRTIGASRRQILVSVVIEALVIGVIASVVGLFSGVGLAWGLDRLFEALNLDLPTTEMVFKTRTVVVSLLIGTIVTLLAGLFPAIRATRVPPIAAVREGATLPPGRFARFTPYVAMLTIALAVLLLALAMFRDELDTAPRLLMIAGGVVSLFVGVALVANKFVRPLARVLSWPGRQLGGAAGKLAGRNASRNPHRTASTAAALMIGIALVTFVATLANGMKASNRGAIEDQISADFVVTSQDGFLPFVGAAGDELAQAADAELVANVRSDLGKAAGSGRYITGIEPDKIASAYNFEWVEGSDAVLGRLGRTGAIIDDDFAEDKTLAVGDRFELLTPNRSRLQLEVKGIYEPPPFYPLLGSVSIERATFDSVYERPKNQFTFVNVPGDGTEDVQKRLEAAVADFPDAKVQTREAWIDKQDADFNQFLTMLYVLLALSVIVSIFGMVNTLVLAVFERTRELGMLRAVGMTRRQVRRMVRHESVITALIGATLGLPLGVFLAAMVTRALSEFDVQFKVPVGQMVVFAIVAVFVGLLAALLPARRAARLRVLEALQYE